MAALPSVLMSAVIKTIAELWWRYAVVLVIRLRKDFAAQNEAVPNASNAAGMDARYPGATVASSSTKTTVETRGEMGRQCYGASDSRTVERAAGISRRTPGELGYDAFVAAIVDLDDAQRRVGRIRQGIQATKEACRVWWATTTTESAGAFSAR